MIRKGIYIILTLSTLLSCSEESYYENNLEIPNHIWSQDLTFENAFLITDTTTPYSIFLDISHDIDYFYENLYLNVETIFPDKEESTNQQLPIDLASKKGLWHGKCSGSTCKLRVVMLDQIKFASPGDYKINLSQYSRQKELEGIKSLDFSLHKVTQ